MGPELGFPTSISIQTTSMCSASCVFCPHRDVKHRFPDHVMDQHLFQSIVKQCTRRREVSMINLFMNNEPLTDPHIVERINYVKEKVPWAAVNLFTNGLLLTDQRISDLLGSRLDWLNVSCHGIRPKTIEKAMGIPGETVLRRINALVDAARSQPRLMDSIGINFLRHQYLSDEEAEEALAYWKRKGLRHVAFFPGPVSRAGNVKDQPCAHHEGRVVGCLSVHADEMLHVCEDGRVVLCCMDWRREVVLGDLRLESIAEVWNGRRMQVWDMIHGFRDMPSRFLCRQCEEAAVDGSNGAESEELDMVVTLLPPSGLKQPPAWVESCVADLDDNGIKVQLLNLDRMCRHKASSTEEALWTEPLTDEHPPEEAFRQLLNRRGGREIVKRCVESLLEVPNKAVVFVVDLENSRFTREVIEQYRKHRPMVKAVVLLADDRLPVDDGWASRVDGVWRETDDLLSNLTDVVAGCGLKILMVHPGDSDGSLRPWTIRIVNTANGLVEMGHEVRFCRLSSVELPDVECPPREGLELISLGRSHTPWALAARYRRLVRYACESDVVHIQRCGVMASLPAILAALRTGIPLHYDWFSGKDAMRSGSKGASLGVFWDRIVRRIAARFRPRIAVPSSVASPGLRPAHRGSWLPAGRILNQSVGVDLRKFHPEIDGRPVLERLGICENLVVAVAPATESGFFGLLDETARLVWRERPDIAFVVVGREDQPSSRRAGSDSCAGQPTMAFTGVVPHAEMPNHLAAADVVVVPQESSPATRSASPLVIAESFACGKPVVASDVGDVAAIVGDAGIVVESGSPEALAQGLIRLFADQALRQQMGERARLRAEENFAWEHLASSVAAAYESSVIPEVEGPRA